ncbi:MAG TPA: NepR family anti-sigma factor [Terricaulis sp.]|nr:NepR family anti-sigma factor [Terricaulis sp.]
MRRKDEMENLVAKKSPPRGANGGGGGKPTSSANKALIARNLRLAFGEVAAEPLPKEWLDLLEKIDEPKGGQ